MNHEKLIHLDLFSGIGGASLAADWIWPRIKHVFCEIDPFCQRVLKKHWPTAQIFGDIRAFTNAEGQQAHPPEPGGLHPESGLRDRVASADPHQLRRVHGELEKLSTTGPHQAQRESASSVEPPFLLTGGFPCQPFSQAGQRKGTEDDRHLWPEMLRVIREFRPRWVVGENVAGFLTWNGGLVFREVLSDLEAEGYEVQAFIIPAVAVNAPHRRDRVWIVANHEGSERPRERPQQSREQGGFTDENTDAPDSERKGLEGRHEPAAEHRQDARTFFGANDWSRNWAEVAARLCGMDDGLPARVDGLELSKSAHRVQRLKGLGNAWVPQVAAEIFKTIKEVDPQ